MKVITTIQLEEGEVLSEEKLSKIQAIIEDKEPPVEGNDDCKEGPQPNSLKVVDSLSVAVGFHAKEVTPIDWIVSDSLSKILGEGTVEPKTNVITLPLKSPVTATPDKLFVTLKGVKCKGEFTGEFVNPYYVPPVVGNPCDKRPEPLGFTKKSEFTGDLSWHGAGVKELEVIVESRSGKRAGGKKVKPQDSDRGHLDIPMTNLFEDEDELLITTKGISCDGGTTKVFPNPFKKKDNGDEGCCNLVFQSVKLTNE